MAQQGFIISASTCRRSFIRHLVHVRSKRRILSRYLVSINRGEGSEARIISATQKFSMQQQRNFTTEANTTMLPAKTLADAFRNATLYSDGRIYKLLRFERPSMELALQIWTESNKSLLSTTNATSSAPPFGCFMVDKDEITMMVENEVYKEHFNSTENNENTMVDDNGINYRLFTFDNVVMDPSLVGFMAVVTKVLAENDISVLPYAAYSTDHVFVADDDAEKTRTILEGLFR